MGGTIRDTLCKLLQLLPPRMFLAALPYKRSIHLQASLIAQQQLYYSLGDIHLAARHSAHKTRRGKQIGCAYVLLQHRAAASLFMLFCFDLPLRLVLSSYTHVRQQFTSTLFTILLFFFNYYYTSKQCGYYHTIPHTVQPTSSSPSARHSLHFSMNFYPHTPTT